MSKPDMGDVGVLLFLIGIAVLFLVFIYIAFTAGAIPGLLVTCLVIIIVGIFLVKAEKHHKETQKWKNLGK